MGQYLKRIDDDTRQALQRAENELAALLKSKEWEIAKSSADLAGMVDPTPTSDAISMGMSITEGDWVGAFLSGVSFVPYFGDAVAKPVKLARTTKAVAVIESKAAALAKTINHYKNTAIRISQQKMAAAAERARRAKEAAEKWAKTEKCVPCAKSGNKFGTHLPTTGTWDGTKGDSLWTSKDKAVSVKYVKGYQDFSTSNPVAIYERGGGRVEIKMVGDQSDFRVARDAMREKLGDPKWPGNGKTEPNGYTWHHKEDGATMELVRTDIHDKAESGAAHLGGASIVSGKNSQF